MTTRSSGGTARAAAPAPPDSAEVARRLISLLLQHGYRQGDRLPAERQLGHDLGVGRSVVREALRSLSLLGIVDLRPGAGTYLSQVADEPVPKVSELGRLLSPRRVADLATVSLHLEAVMAGFAAERRSADAIADLDRLQADLVAGRRPVAVTDVERTFHAAVWEAASNHVLAEILASIRALLDASLSGAIETATDQHWVVQDHTTILEAIRYRESEAAHAAMVGHMTRVAQRLTAAGKG
ncbi:MAG: FadR family transcriptional regulator [Chloroflexi bacterium]|nr:FadR family transcriptional regulator [Chloroflexota bacterium]